jgi:hypothetical protein
MRLNQKPAVGDVVRYEKRVVALDGLFVISVYNPCRCRNAVKKVRRETRLCLPHLGDLVEEQIKQRF